MKNDRNNFKLGDKKRNDKNNNQRKNDYENDEAARKRVWSQIHQL